MNELRDMMYLPTEAEREEQKIRDRIDAVVAGRDKRIVELENIVRDALASFRCTQSDSDYSADDWPNRAAAFLKEQP